MLGAFLLGNASPCFTPGTLIATDQGQRAVETLKRGDKIVTRDNGLKRVQWVGRREFGYEDLFADPSLQPVLIRAGAFGNGQPRRDMIVSPNHRFLVGKGVTHITGDSEETLISARNLIDDVRIKPAAMLGVSYLHILCNSHEVVLANGAWTESFHPDDAVMKSIAKRQRDEILALFPEVATMGAGRRFRPARAIKDRRSRFER